MKKKKFGLVIMLFALMVSSAFLLSGCKKKADPVDESDSPETTNDDGSEADSGDMEDDTDGDMDGDMDDSDDRADDDGDIDDTADLGDFSDDPQDLGSSEDKQDSEYSLEDIDDQAMGGYHRFVFDLASDDETELPQISTQLVSGGGYIQIVLDRVTDDNSGIAYQDARSINQKGVIRIYHDISANQSEEIYNIGIADDTEFYLHADDDMNVILDVAYPGEGEDDDDDDTDAQAGEAGEFGTGDQSLSDTNTSGTATVNSYTWALGGNALKFVWNTSASSGDPIPQTSAVYDEDEDEVRVTFQDLQKDSVYKVMDITLSGPVENVSAEYTDGTSVYTFELTKGTEYRIYKTLSPNQVVLEVKR
jgi:hypothetical protein